ncbi:MAG TPA: DUF1588 domain-containing protein, partial [Polyangia bacterium]
AALYGVANVQGDALTQVNLDPKERAGLLTQPALLALWSDPARTDPSRRGTRVLEKIFCRPIPPPPANIPPAAALTPGMTQRQATEAISTTLAACAACHNLMDPPGLVYENFDAIGRWRTTDNGQPVDVSGLSIGIASGLNVSIADAPVVVNGPIELANVAAQAASSQQCMAQQWLMYALKLMYTLNTSTQIDALVADVYPIFKSSGFNLKELIVSVLTTDAFLAP